MTQNPITQDIQVSAVGAIAVDGTTFISADTSEGIINREGGPSATLITSGNNMVGVIMFSDGVEFSTRNAFNTDTTNIGPAGVFNSALVRPGEICSLRRSATAPVSSDPNGDFGLEISGTGLRITRILDDLGEVEEVYEDNNAVAYCDPLTVNQLSPVIDPLPQQTIVAGEPYTGPTPTVTHPLNMSPITWSLDNAPPGMTIDPATGVVSWPDPVPDPFLYTVIIRATNGAGSSTQYLFLGVLDGPDACPADCGPDEGDGVVNVLDFLLMLSEWGSAGPFDCDMAPDGGDGAVNVLDFLFLLSSWGACP